MSLFTHARAQTCLLMGAKEDCGWGRQVSSLVVTLQNVSGCSRTSRQKTQWTWSVRLNLHLASIFGHLFTLKHYVVMQGSRPQPNDEALRVFFTNRHTIILIYYYYSMLKNEEGASPPVRLWSTLVAVSRTIDAFFSPYKYGYKVPWRKKKKNLTITVQL